ncbi:MAG: galactosyltransferase Lgt5 [Mesorhizobium sp.]|jgi:hypothetical protein|uniref:hypothetical protein n=1 Tax=Mesorhizobium sp. TaxID=1871066 RepID=UPI000FE729C9|nr:hypothetical protein [Mesorhizobium sp.]RWM19627.1 MAG: galactosyltransferase Lgt5 [Mesorhizobium sp.]
MRPAEPVVNALWIGDALGEIHAACLRSFLLAGHHVLLHCYDVPGNVPKGVEIFDASQLMPRERIIAYRSNGSPSLFSNLYRLKILEAGMGLYVDCDVYCLKRIPQAAYIFGYQTDTEINGAVLKLPADSDMLREALKMVDDPYFIAPWLGERKRRRYHLRRAIGLPIDISHYGWGMLGPCAMTYFAGKAGVMGHASSIDVFYPVHYSQVSLLLDPDLSLADIVTSRTLCIHLCDNSLKVPLGDRPIPAGSPLSQLLELSSLPAVG